MMRSTAMTIRIVASMREMVMNMIVLFIMKGIRSIREIVVIPMISVLVMKGMVMDIIFITMKETKTMISTITIKKVTIMTNLITIKKMVMNMINITIIKITTLTIKITTTPTRPLLAIAIAFNAFAPFSRQLPSPLSFSLLLLSDSSHAEFPPISSTLFSTSRNALLLSSRIMTLTNRILAAVAVDRFLFLQLAGRTVATEIPQISEPGFPAVPMTIRDFEPSLRKVREFHLPTVSSRFTSEEKATDSLRRLAMKLPGYVHHVTDRPAGNPYEEVIREIIAGKQSIEALRLLVQTDWRLHRRAFHIPAIPREDSDETPLPPGPHGRRNSGNFLSLCVSLGRFIQIWSSETARVPREFVGGSFTGSFGEFRARFLRVFGRSSFAGVSFHVDARGSVGRDPLDVASPPLLYPDSSNQRRSFIC